MDPSLQPSEEGQTPYEMRTVTVLPDSLHKTDEAADTYEGGVYHIASLDLDLAIPEGYYIYRVDGMFRGPDYEHDFVRMEFVDEYIMTMQEVTEEQLVKDSWEQFDEYTGKRYSPNFRGPEYVVFSFRVFHKDYLPVESLYYPALMSNREVRVAGDYVIEMGLSLYRSSQAYAVRDRGEVEGDTYTFPNGKTAKVIYEDEFPLSGWLEAIRSGSLGSGIRYWDNPMLGFDDAPRTFLVEREQTFRNHSAGDLAGSIRIAGGSPVWAREKSVLSDGWWSDYTEALGALDLMAGGGAYPENMVLPEYPAMYSAADAELDSRADWYRYEQEMITGWHADGTTDHTLRAFIYACLKAGGRDVQLSRVVIAQKLSPTGFPLYTAYDLDPESGVFEFLENGGDYLWLTDLSIARDYVLEHLVQAVE
ncbi:MAG: hypothetical protein J6Z23_05865 [Lachnospiraceae bacterium]|nr:hypothetical protein [Lachnospiraceae bacterium]